MFVYDGNGDAVLATPLAIRGVHIECMVNDAQCLVPVTAAVNEASFVEAYVELNGGSETVGKWPDGSSVTVYDILGLITPDKKRENFFENLLKRLTIMVDRWRS
jgi:hypothetical protein